MRRASFRVAPSWLRYDLADSGLGHAACSAISDRRSPQRPHRAPSGRSSIPRVLWWRPLARHAQATHGASSKPAHGLVVLVFHLGRTASRECFPAADGFSAGLVVLSIARSIVYLLPRTPRAACPWIGTSRTAPGSQCRPQRCVQRSWPSLRWFHGGLVVADRDQARCARDEIAPSMIIDARGGSRHGQAQRKRFLMPLNVVA